MNGARRCRFSGGVPAPGNVCPPPVHWEQGNPGAAGRKPSSGTANRRVSRKRRGASPLRVPEATRKADAAWAQSRGCKGRSPLQKNNFESPPSPPGKGVGEMGAEGSYEVGANRRRQGTGTPYGAANRRVSRKRRAQAPLKPPERRDKQGHAVRSSYFPTRPHTLEGIHR